MIVSHLLLILHKKHSFISLCLKPEMWQKVAKFKGAKYFRKALYFQVSPEMLDWVQVRALAAEPILHGLGCVLRVIVLLEGEPLPQSEVLSVLRQVFIKDLFVLCSVHLSLNPE